MVSLRGAFHETILQVYYRPGTIQIGERDFFAGNLRQGMRRGVEGIGRACAFHVQVKDSGLMNME
jgi:hypothetical protein